MSFHAATAVLILALLAMPTHAQSPQALRDRIIADATALAALVGPPVVRVPAGGDLRAAVASAPAGAIIELSPLAVYDVGATTLTLSNCVKLTPAGWDAASPVRAVLTGSLEVVTIDGCATVRGVEIRGNFRHGIWLEPTANALIEHNYIHGLTQAWRGIKLDGTAIVQDNLIDEIKWFGLETHGIWAYQGGPYTIQRNTVYAAGIGIFFGGKDPLSEADIPHDLTVTNNYVGKRLAWRFQTQNGQSYSAKNLLELKNAKRATITANTFEYSYREGQSGFCIAFTVRNQEGNAPFSTVEDVVFESNTIRHCAGGVTVLGSDDTPGKPSQTQKRIAIRHNTFEDISRTAWSNGGNGNLFQINRGTDDLDIRGNVVVGANNVNAFLMLIAPSLPLVRFTFADNDVPEGLYGIFGNDVGIGGAALNTYAPGYTWSANTIRRTVLSNSWVYPSGTTVISQ